jgi:hypothetical protein
MGIDYRTIIFADDPDFVPTRDQLHGIAATFLETAIIDERECRRLNRKIDSIKSDDLYSLGYTPNGTGAFPGFKATKLVGGWMPVDKVGPILPLSLKLFDEAETMEDWGAHKSRFIIAMVQVNGYRVPEDGWWAKPVAEIEGDEIVNLEIKDLCAKLTQVLGVPVLAEFT